MSFSCRRPHGQQVFHHVVAISGPVGGSECVVELAVEAVQLAVDRVGLGIGA